MPIHLPPISRRRFLAGAAAAGAGLLSVRSVLATTRSVDPHRWALFSDTHIAEDPNEAAHGVTMLENLRRASEEVLALEQAPAGVMINGDCAYLHGKSGDYATLVEGLKPLRAGQLPIHMALGNHDHRENFWDAFEQSGDTSAAVDNRHVSVIESPRANWFVLDSLDVTNVTPGELGQQQITWLAEALDRLADKPAIVLAHHHPVRGGRGTGLRDTDALFDMLLPRKQVKAYIFGHTHQWRVAKWEDLHVINLPPVAYVFNAQAPSGWVQVDLQEDGATFELRSLDPAHEAHGQKVDLRWRAA